MTRPLFLTAGAALACAASVGCAEREPYARWQAAYPPPASASASPGTRVAERPPSPRTGATGQTFSAPPPSTADRDRAALAEACRRDADRVVLYRDRGQLMREDERDARVGTDSSIYARRIETDRLGRVFERDRVAAQCLEQGSQPQPARR